MIVNFVEILKHKAESRGCVSHRVCAMKHHEAIVGLIILLYHPGYVGYQWEGVMAEESIGCSN